MNSSSNHHSVRLSGKRRPSSSSSLPLQSPNKRKYKAQVWTLPATKSTLASNLLQLPIPVLERLLLIIDVSNLQRLSSTCYFFHQLISGCHIISLDFPRSQTFLSELKMSDVIEKKPLHRLQSLKADNTILPSGRPVFVDYMVTSQLALLDLTKLRELILLPSNLTSQNVQQ